MEINNLISIANQPSGRNVFESFAKGNNAMQKVLDGFYSVDEYKKEEESKHKKGVNIRLFGHEIHLKKGFFIVAATLVTAAVMHKRVGWFGEKARSLYKNLSSNIDKLKDQKFITPFEQFSLSSKEKMKKVLDYVLSFNQIKDRTLGKALGPFRKQINKVIANFRNAAIKTTGDKYKKLGLITDKMERNLANLSQKMRLQGLSNEADKIDELLLNNKLKNSINNGLISGFNDRISSMNQHLKEVVDGYDNLIKGTMPKSSQIKDVFKEIPDSFNELGSVYVRLRDGALENTRQNLADPLKVAKTSLQELSTLLDDIHNKTPDLSKEILVGLKRASKDVHKVSKNINNATSFEIDNLTNRLFDLDLDGGILEVATPIITTGILANEVRKAETMEDKKAKLVSLGIPIIGGLGAWYYSAVLKCYSAVSGLVFGFATAYGFDKIGEVVSKKLFGSDK